MFMAGGDVLCQKAMVLMPGEGYEGVTKLLDVMTSYGLILPPLLVGVGVATSVETAMFFLKGIDETNRFTILMRELLLWRNY